MHSEHHKFVAIPVDYPTVVLISLFESAAVQLPTFCRHCVSGCAVVLLRRMLVARHLQALANHSIRSAILDRVLQFKLVEDDEGGLVNLLMQARCDT